jgi:succinyl-diaminopimelate desuccinylase
LAPALLTPRSTLSQALAASIRTVTSTGTSCDTSGIRRPFHRILPQVIEFRPPNATIHQVNEHRDR